MSLSLVKPTIQVVAAIIQKNNQFLITKRLKKSHLGHCWEFPGGKIEPNETVEECIIRECKEEIDVVVKPIKKIKELTHEYSEVIIHLYFMFCELTSGIPKAIECADLKWVEAKELSQFEFPEADAQIIKALVNEDKKN